MRHIEVRIADQVYVYLHDDAIHVETINAPIPASWWGRGSHDDAIVVTDRTIRRFVRSLPEAWGWGRITDLHA